MQKLFKKKLTLTDQELDLLAASQNGMNSLLASVACRIQLAKFNNGVDKAYIMCVHVGGEDETLPAIEREAGSLCAAE